MRDTETFEKSQPWIWKFGFSLAERTGNSVFPAPQPTSRTRIGCDVGLIAADRMGNYNPKRNIDQLFVL